jgi:hypothetical protein
VIRGCRFLFGILGGLGRGGYGIEVGSIGMMGGVWMLASTEVALMERSEINREKSRESCDQGSRSSWIMVHPA